MHACWRTAWRRCPGCCWMQRQSKPISCSSVSTSSTSASTRTSFRDVWPCAACALAHSTTAPCAPSPTSMSAPPISAVAWLPPPQSYCNHNAYEHRDRRRLRCGQPWACPRSQVTPPADVSRSLPYLTAHRLPTLLPHLHNYFRITSTATSAADPCRRRRRASVQSGRLSRLQLAGRAATCACMCQPAPIWALCLPRQPARACAGPPPPFSRPASPAPIPHPQRLPVLAPRLPPAPAPLLPSLPFPPPPPHASRLCIATASPLGRAMD